MIKSPTKGGKVHRISKRRSKKDLRLFGRIQGNPSESGVWKQLKNCMESKETIINLQESDHRSTEPVKRISKRKKKSQITRKDERELVQHDLRMRKMGNGPRYRWFRADEPVKWKIQFIKKKNLGFINKFKGEEEGIQK